MKTFVSIIVSVFIVVLGICGDMGQLLGIENLAYASSSGLYTCPMHPSYISTKPGSCPICGMDLVLVDNNSLSSTHATGPDHSQLDQAESTTSDSKTSEQRSAGHGTESAPRAKVDSGTTITQTYTCPMHPSYISTKPGSCPICGMNLVLAQDRPTTGGQGVASGRVNPNSTNLPVEEKSFSGQGTFIGTPPPTPRQGEMGAKARGPVTYYCPMHPSYTSPRPGSCPICGMDLVLLEQEETHQKHSFSPVTGTNVPGRIPITVSPEKQQKIGVRLDNVQKKRFTKTIRLTAILDHDETLYTRLAPRFSGWIQKLYANFTGQQIARGSPLMSVYSPELLSASTEYLVALEHFEKVKNTPDTPDFIRAKNLLESAKTKLALWEIQEDQIREIEKARHPLTELLLRAPISGHIITMKAREGSYFAAGDTLFEIGNLSHLWARIYIYEQDYPYIKPGQKAQLVLPYLKTTVEGQISYIYPHIDENTRRAEARVDIPNPNEIMRPGMWGYADVTIDYGEQTLIPASAVLDTGERYLAFVVRDDGVFEPREIDIGVKADDFFQVLGGLQKNETIVATPLFLIDAESQLKSAILGISPHKH